MSSETFTTAMFLISAVIAAGVLINAVFPVITTMTGTVASSSHQADTRIRTDLRIINSYASAPDATIWIKNVGSSHIQAADLNGSDVFIGRDGDFERVTKVSGTPSSGEWTYAILDDANDVWDPKETVEISLESTKVPASGEWTYFQIVLPNGVARSTEFTAEG